MVAARVCMVDVDRDHRPNLSSRVLGDDVFLHTTYLHKLLKHDATALANVLSRWMTDHRVVQATMKLLADLRAAPRSSSIVRSILAHRGDARVHFTDVLYEPIVHHMYRKLSLDAQGHPNSEATAYLASQLPSGAAVARMLLAFLTSRNIIGTLNNGFGAAIDRKTYGRFAFACHKVHKQLLKLPRHVRGKVVAYFARRIQAALRPYGRSAKGTVRAWREAFEEVSNAYAACRAAAYGMRAQGNLSVVAPRRTLAAVRDIMKFCGVNTHECGGAAQAGRDKT